MPEKSFIQPGHFRRADEMEANLELPDAQIIQRRQENFSEQTQVDFSRALAIEKIQSLKFQVSIEC